MVLQQCAHFYNNIATEMIRCQKPMMLAEAVEFEKVGDIAFQMYLTTNLASWVSHSMSAQLVGTSVQDHSGLSYFYHSSSATDNCNVCAACVPSELCRY
jgi:hypothetical protein